MKALPVILTFAAALTLGACADVERDVEDDLRGGKADEVLVGSCADSCGGPSLDGNCWCDEKCESLGDCCDDLAICTQPACSDLDPDVCEEHADCQVIVGPGDAPDGALGGALMCIDAPECSELDPDECEVRPDCLVIVGPGDAPDGALGGALMCIEN